MSARPNLERAAVKLAVEGFDVFPVTPGRKDPPLVKFTQAATSDPIAVAETWCQHPAANIGVRTGGGTFVLDVDSYKPGTGLDFEIPETMSVKTPRGGRHYYFTGDAPTRADVRPGIDVRGKGGYALGAGSRIGDRAYEWITPPWELPPQPASAELLDLVRERVRRQAISQGPIPEGTRVVTLVRIAGYFVGHDVRGEPLAVALHSVNRSRCKPPLSEKEVEKVVQSASKWDVAPPWIADPQSYVEDPRLDLKAHVLLMTLAQRADADGLVRGGEWLQQATTLHRNSITNAAQKLEAFGRIEVERKRREANVYRLLPPPPAPLGS